MPENIERMKKMIESYALLQREVGAFFAMSLDLCCIADASTMTFTRLNPRWEVELGWTEEELMSKPYTEFVHPDDRDATSSASSKLVDGINIVSFVNRYEIKGGGLAHLEWTSTMDEPSGMVFATARILKKEYREE